MEGMEPIQEVDLNAASAAALAALPGVDEATAEAIIAYREAHGPIRSPQELLDIDGIDEATLARITPWLKLGTETEPVQLQDESQKEEQVLHEAPEKPPEEEPPPSSRPTRPDHPLTPGAAGTEPTPPRAPMPSPPATPSARIAWWAWLWSALVGGLLGMIFTLLVLSGINGSLNINRSRAVQENRAQIETLQSDLNAANSELTSLDKRLRVLEGLTARVETVENRMETIEQRFGNLEKEMGNLQETVEETQRTLNKLAEAQSKTEQFFQGLQQLLTEIVGSQPEPQLSPTHPPTP